jgi:hypothetical protein
MLLRLKIIPILSVILYLLKTLKLLQTELAAVAHLEEREFLKNEVT